MMIIIMVIDDDDNDDESDDEICALLREGRNSIDDFFESRDLDWKWVEEFLSVIFWLID